MPKAKFCMVKLSVAQALKIRDLKDSVVKDSMMRFKCVECGRAVRPTIKTVKASSFFSHLRRNKNCSLSDPLIKANT